MKESFKVSFGDDQPKLFVDCKRINGDLVDGNLLCVGYREIHEFLIEMIGPKSK